MLEMCKTKTDSISNYERKSIITSYQTFQKGLPESIQEVFNNNKTTIVKAEIEHFKEVFEYGWF